MKTNQGDQPQKWERTNVTNLLRNRQSGIYYARVKVNGKQKWRTLDTSVFTVAKLRLADVERAVKAQALAAKSQTASGNATETGVNRFIDGFRDRITGNPRLAESSKARTLDAVKTLIKTWPDLPGRDVRRLSQQDCQAWAVTSLREGTGFIAPRVKTKRKGMAPSSFNKCLDVLRGILEIAREEGMLYENPAKEIAKAPKRAKRLELPSAEQFQSIMQRMATAGSRWSVDAADLARLLAYSGARLREATALQWRHIDSAKGVMTLPGSKSATSYRVIPIFPSLAALLKGIRERRGSEPADAPIVRVGSCMDGLKAACRVAGVKAMTHHDLRHLFATRCIESGVDIPTVSRWMGHADGGALAMQTYGHLRQEHSMAQAAKVVF